MTKYKSSIDGLQRILDEYPGTRHSFDYAFLSEEESKKIIREARDTIVELQGMVEAYERAIPDRELTRREKAEIVAKKTDEMIKRLSL